MIVDDEKLFELVFALNQLLVSKQLVISYEDGRFVPVVDYATHVSKTGGCIQIDNLEVDYDFI